MDLTSIERIAERLELLERRNRNFKFAIFSTAIIVAGIFLMGQGTTSKIPAEIVAQRFTLKDETGRVAAIFATMLPRGGGGSRHV